MNPVTWFGKNPEVIKRFISFLSILNMEVANESSYLVWKKSGSYQEIY